MTDLIVVPQAANWQRLKRLVLDSVSSPITRRVYNLGLDEFFEWFGREPRPGFTKAAVAAWRVALEVRGLGAVSINVRITAVRKLAVEAADNGLLAPELAAGITRVKGAASKGVRMGNWLSVKQAQTLLDTPDISTTKGLRDRAILAVLLGCGVLSIRGCSAHRWPCAAAGRALVHRGSSRKTRPGADDPDADVGKGAPGCVDVRRRARRGTGVPCAERVRPRARCGPEREGCLAATPGICGSGGRSGLAGDWSPRPAAQYLDSRQKEWFAWPAAKRSGGPCISCHTGATYLLARLALRRVLGEAEPTTYETGLVDGSRAGVGSGLEDALKTWEGVCGFAIGGG